MYSVIEETRSDPWEWDEYTIEAATIEAATWAANESTGRSLPHNLDAEPPGPFLALALSQIDVDRCSGRDRITVLRAHQRMASHYQAHTYRDMVSVSDHLEKIDDGDLELANEGTVAEVRVALNLTRRAADAEVSFAIDLKRRLPAVWSAFSRGDLDVRRARTIVLGTSHLAEDVARQVADTIVAEAADRTTGQLAARIRKLCIDVDPGDAAERYEQAVDSRRVVFEPTPDGTAQIFCLDLPAHRVAVASDRINLLARSLKTAEEPRTMDQLRADVLLDLLSGTEEPHSRSRGTVNLHVDLATLAELTESAGDLAGYGPVVADIARQVAKQQARQKWEYTVHDSGTGFPVQAGTTKRRPSLSQQREVRAINTTCVFPGCRMPAAGCDLDHRDDWAHGGATATENLDPLCRHDHRNKHKLGWTYRRLDTGQHEWTTKLGHIYTTVGPP